MICRRLFLPLDAGDHIHHIITGIERSVMYARILIETHAIDIHFGIAFGQIAHGSAIRSLHNHIGLAFVLPQIKAAVVVTIASGTHHDDGTIRRWCGNHCAHRCCDDYVARWRRLIIDAAVVIIIVTVDDHGFVVSRDRGDGVRDPIYAHRSELWRAGPPPTGTRSAPLTIEENRRTDTPLRAIRAKCSERSAGQPKEVRNCHMLGLCKRYVGI